MSSVLRSVRRTAALAGSVILAAAVLTPHAAAKPGGVPAIPLNAEQETTGSTSTGSGFVTYTIEGDQLCYTLSVSGLTQAPFGAHIHPGDRGFAGPVAVPLLTPPAATSTVSDCITAAEGSGILTPQELAAIAADPTSFYVNVHTSNWPGGEVRGQLK